MTIKELENLVGMTRANIRFYEQEGLLSPARMENGYRNYSQEDANTLCKIKLLRQLQIDLDAIRALQSGERDLEPTLRHQLATLERDQAALNRVREVCRSLGESGADYATMDPKPWLDELERVPVPAPSRFSPPGDARLSDSLCYPWRRYFARYLDLSIYTLILNTIFMLGFRVNMTEHWFTSLVQSYIAIGIMLLAEPFFLRTFATTPGKFILGIRVRNAEGNRLTLSQAVRRTLAVFTFGMGFGIPFYEFWRNLKCRNMLDHEKPMPWERDEQYTVSRRSGLCWISFLAVRILIFGISILLALSIYLPPNRGELTVAEFCENVNFYLEELEPDSSYYLDEQGNVNRKNYSNVIQIGGRYTTSYDFDFILEDGMVTGLTLTCNVKGTGLLSPSGYYWSQFSILALAGAQDGFNPFEMDVWAGLVTEEAWVHETSYEGISVSWATTFEGPVTAVDGSDLSDIAYSSYLMVPDGETGSISQVYQIILEESP